MTCRGCNCALNDSDVVVEVCRDLVFCTFCAIHMTVENKKTLDMAAS